MTCDRESCSNRAVLECRTIDQDVHRACDIHLSSLVTALRGKLQKARRLD